MNCPQCGKTILDTSKFCPFCGATILAAAPAAPEATEVPKSEAPEQNTAGEQYRQPYQQQYQQPYQQYQQPYQPFTPPAAPETNKPRSAYIAALLHIFLGVFGFGYNYRGMHDKAKNCLIALLVGALTSLIFGLGAVVILICQIINIIEAVKLFRGEITTDFYGRTLYQEF